MRRSNVILKPRKVSKASKKEACRQNSPPAGLPGMGRKPGQKIVAGRTTLPYKPENKQASREKKVYDLVPAPPAGGAGKIARLFGCGKRRTKQKDESPQAFAFVLYPFSI